MSEMENLGIVQAGHPTLASTSEPFNLPGEIDEAARIISLLGAKLEEVRKTGPFAKGMGIAAPQIGILRAAALIDTSDAGLIVLLNPRLTAASPESNDRYEGCLSFFDVRGLVPRPLAITVKYEDLSGAVALGSFTEATARLVCHEIDHLNGMVYTARMQPGVMPIPVEEYKQEGKPWTY